jgi:hypothetical protein
MANHSRFMHLAVMWYGVFGSIINFDLGMPLSYQTKCQCELLQYRSIKSGVRPPVGNFGMVGRKSGAWHLYQIESVFLLDFRFFEKHLIKMVLLFRLVQGWTTI